jgi:S-adenosylmethionine hydrolase
MRIALLTDFGTVDPYVAVMKGVLASRTDAAIYDLTHEIPPFDVFAAAWFLATVAPWWPRAIFVCVVDPGVGTARKIVAMERGGEVGEEPGRSNETPKMLAGPSHHAVHSAKKVPRQVTPPDRPLPPGEGRGEGLIKTQLFLAPDNGLLSMIGGAWRAVSVENEALFLPHGSTTFHGRDRFAPVAAALANGTPLDELGPPMSGIVRLDYEPPSYGDAVVRGTIVSVDRFGNCITDIEAARITFPRLALHAGAHVITRLHRAYGEAGAGAFVITGSTGHLEISVANGDAAMFLGLRRGDHVEVGKKSEE